MKNLLAKVCIVASCVTFSAQSLNAAAAPAVEPSTTSLAASLMAAEKRNAVSDEELFGEALSYSTELNPIQADAAVGQILPVVVLAGAAAGFLLSCYKSVSKTETRTECDANGTNCKTVITVTQYTAWDCVQ
jgi:hypothetical protein